MADAGRRATPGEVIFARYAYPPNELGYCGVGDGREWWDAAASGLAGDVGGRPLADLARSFDGAWPYLEYLAEVAGVGDPLDPAVTTAYWVGNRLLDEVDAADFAQRAREWFAHQLGADWSSLNGEPAALPHHSFHVFAIYPWLGLLRRTGSVRALDVLDQCRIRWGTVIATDGDRMTVRSRPLTWDGRRLRLGAPRLEDARWADGGRSLLDAVAPGQWVSLHWEWVCDVLTRAQLASLRRLTAHQLSITNRSSAR